MARSIQLLVLGLLVSLLAACGGTTGPAALTSVSQTSPKAADSLSAVVEGARKEGTLQLVWGGGAVGAADGARMLADGINKRYNLNLNVQFTLGPSMPDMS